MTPPYRPTIRSRADLQQFWRTLVTPRGIRQRSLWIVLIGSDDRPTPVLTEIDELPQAPDGLVAGLADMLSHLQHDEPGARWALLLCRPGHHATDEADLAWARALRDALHGRGLRHEPIHLATDLDIVSVEEQPGYRRAS